LLAEHFLRLFARTGGAREISPEAMEAIAQYNWPGNVRELQNVIERLAVTAPGTLISGAVAYLVLR